MSDHRCPICNYSFEESTAVNDAAERKPKPDDISFCFNCSTMLIFSGDLKLRLPTKEEMTEIDGNKQLSKELTVIKLAIQHKHSQN